MTDEQDMTPFEAGRDIYGPVVAEFCLRLWMLGTQLDHAEETVQLWCARGGLRMRAAYERFLAALGLPAAVRSQDLMISRVAAARPAVVRSLRSGDVLLPAVARTLDFEFGRSTVAETATALSGVPVGGDRWGIPYRAADLLALFRHQDGQEAKASLEEQGDLFLDHLRDKLDGRQRALLVDTGLYGTTLDLVAEADPAVRYGSILLARSFRGRRADQNPACIGLGVTAWRYSPLQVRTALLRHWHFVEWLFEPELPSVRTFRREAAGVVSNLQVPGWVDQVPGPADAPFAGVLCFMDSLAGHPPSDVLEAAPHAWARLRRALVWPDAAAGKALVVGSRSDDFGRDRVWGVRRSASVLASLRGPATWREGEIARSGSRWRLPALAAVETAYAGRSTIRRFRPENGNDGT